jgi:2-polyprenyl-3-methyl-5-hydroxy-6-metoxy-1,4-benzoquinol methylase
MTSEGVLGGLTSADRCAACGSIDVSLLEPRISLFYSCCKACGHCLQLMEAGDGSGSFERAQIKYYGDTSQFSFNEPNLFDREVIADRALVLNTVLQVGDDVLEVGPGGGHVLRWLTSMGHRVTAIEHSAALASELTKFTSANVKVGDFESLSIDGPFDVFCSFHVIEHVTDSHTHLSKAYALVRPGGFALVATPNARSWQQILFPALSPNFDSAHLCVFSPASLRSLCEKSGWQVIRVETPEFSAGWLRVLTKGLRRLRNESEEDTAGKYSRANSPFMWLVSKIIQIVTLPFRSLQRISGYGNEIFVVLRKP